VAIYARRVKAFVDVETVEFVMSKQESISACTLIGSLDINANLLAVMKILTLIEIIASLIISSKHKACFAST
jgi:hypothetical protein